MICEWIGHKFRPRYSSEMPERFRRIRGGSPEHIEALMTKTYHRDVCERCGKVLQLERKP